jgi:pyruvate dehydrogenase E2 component (dihydrolipoamide acetyltransferase)
MIRELIFQSPSETVDEVEVIRILVAVGDSIAVEQPVLEVETVKAAMEFFSNMSGTVREILIKEGETLKVDQVVLLCEVSEAGDAPAEAGAGEGTPEPKAFPSPVPPSATQPPLPDFSKWGAVERKPMSALRRATADHMAAAWLRIPHVTHHELADITVLEDWRRGLDKIPASHGTKPTLTALLVKCVASAVALHPKLNASLDVAAGEEILKKPCHAGVAVDTPSGLVVPVIRDAETKDIFQISTELSQLAEKARQGDLDVSEMQGGTFTISNLGGLGVGFFTPIVNWPQVAILGVGRSALQPVWMDGQFTPRLMLPLSLSYDHRLIDGADAARFMRSLIDAMSPSGLFP